MKTIKLKLNDYELNLIHGLLADEEIRLKKAYKIISKNGDNFGNTKNYIEKVNKLRIKFSNMDDSEDYFEVFNRIEENSLDTKKGRRMKWNKLTTRPIEDEEKECYPDCSFIWDGATPEIGEVVLVSYGDNTDVWMDTWVEFDVGTGFLDREIEVGEICYWMEIPEIDEEDEEQ